MLGLYSLLTSVVGNVQFWAEVMQMLVQTIGFGPYEVVLMTGIHVNVNLRSIKEWFGCQTLGPHNSNRDDSA